MDSGGACRRKSKKELSAEIIAWSEEHGYTQEKFAEMADISTRTVQRIWKGDFVLNEERICRLSMLMHKKPDFFLTYEYYAEIEEEDNTLNVSEERQPTAKPEETDELDCILIEVRSERDPVLRKMYTNMLRDMLELGGRKKLDTDNS